MTLPSLRYEIAENLDNLARCAIAVYGQVDPKRHSILSYGAADTLRWTEGQDLEPDSCAAELERAQYELDAYEAARDSLDALCTAQLTKATALTPAAFRDAIREILADLP